MWVLPFLISSLAVGLVVAVFLPWAKTQLDALPGFARVTSNRLVQLIVVGGIVLAGIGVFGWIAKRVRA